MSEPGEPPPYQPYGVNPYGGAPAGQQRPAAAPTDPVSIVGLVLSLLCCTSLAGLVVGLVGLSRTKGGRRGGRWAAITAVAIGAVGTLAGAGVLGFFIWFGTSTVSLGSADVGQCVNIDEFSSGNDATLFKRDCDEPHEAEIVVSDEFDRDLVDAYSPGDPDAVCAGLLSGGYAEADATGDYRLGLVFDSDEPEPGDDFVCYLERVDGKDLDEPIRG